MLQISRIAQARQVLIVKEARPDAAQKLAGYSRYLGGPGSRLTDEDNVPELSYRRRRVPPQRPFLPWQAGRLSSNLVQSFFRSDLDRAPPGPPAANGMTGS
jgi:hypothetical protein